MIDCFIDVILKVIPTSIEITSRTLLVDYCRMRCIHVEFFYELKLSRAQHSLLLSVDATWVKLFRFGKIHEFTKISLGTIEMLILISPYRNVGHVIKIQICLIICL